MDINKLKGRPPYPFETIAVAIAFSPRLEGILFEANSISLRFGSKLILIHVGGKTANKSDKLNKLFQKLQMDETKTQVIWKEGNAVETILSVCKENVVDLLILGALNKESLLTFYLGSLARNISRKAKCSVLLLTHPGSHAKKPNRIIVNGVDNPKTPNTLNTAIYFGKAYDSKDIRVVREIDMTGLAMTISDSTATDSSKARKEFTEDEETKLRKLISASNANGMEIKDRVVKGKPGYALAKYAREKKADLLVINSPDTHLNLLDRIFTHDIEYILADLPCDVLIVHSRVKKEI